MEKPKITVLGTDNLFEVAHKARKAMQDVYTDQEIDDAIAQLFKAEPISACTAGIERYLDVAYEFGQSKCDAV